MNNKKTIEVLNSLIIINNYRIQGYKTASEETRENYLKALFGQFCSTSLKCKQELVNAVNGLNGEVADVTLTSGIFYREWMDAKAALTCNDRKAILKSCELGEDIAISVYKNVLKDDLEYLNTGQQNLITNQISFLNADHNLIKLMLVTMAVA
jgi:uncharacterized protein (TIGR02284 family)